MVCISLDKAEKNGGAVAIIQEAKLGLWNTNPLFFQEVLKQLNH